MKRACVRARWASSTNLCSVPFSLGAAAWELSATARSSAIWRMRFLVAGVRFM